MIDPYLNPRIHAHQNQARELAEPVATAPQEPGTGQPPAATATPPAEVIHLSDEAADPQAPGEGASTPATHGPDLAASEESPSPLASALLAYRQEPDAAPRRSTAASRQAPEPSSTAGSQAWPATASSAVVCPAPSAEPSEVAQATPGAPSRPAVASTAREHAGALLGSEPSEPQRSEPSQRSDAGPRPSSGADLLTAAPASPGQRQAAGAPSGQLARQSSDPQTSTPAPTAEAQCRETPATKKGPFDLSDTFLGRMLARFGKQRTQRGGDGRHCFKGVADALDRVGINLKGMHAYQAADQLARNGKVAEVRGLKPSDLPKLPSGAIVVWNRGNGHRSGHISIASGDGREYSDVRRQQVTQYGTSFRVFMPK